MWTKFIEVDGHTFWIALDNTDTPFFNVTTGENPPENMSGYYNIFWLLNVKGCFNEWGKPDTITDLVKSFTKKDGSFKTGKFTGANQ